MVIGTQYATLHLTDVCNLYRSRAVHDALTEYFMKNYRLKWNGYHANRGYVLLFTLLGIKRSLVAGRQGKDVLLEPEADNDLLLSSAPR